MKPKDILNKTLLTVNFLNVWSKGSWYKDKEKGWIPASLIYLG